MKCPVDDTTLLITERQGVEIDYCPQCRGVWLDRGELDKIIDRVEPRSPANERTEETPYTERYDDRHERRDHHYSDDHHKHKKREGFLGDLFDFGD